METPVVSPEKVRRPWWKRLLRLTVWLGVSCVALIGLAFLLLVIFEDDVKKYVMNEANKHLNTVVYIDPADIDLTLFSSFPDVALEFRNVKALDAVPDEKRDTLFRAARVALSFSLLDFFRSNYTIREIELETAELNLWVDKQGRDNYHFLKDAGAATDTAKVAFAIEHIGLEAVRVRYTDKAAGGRYEVLLNEVNCSGDFSTDQYALETDADFTVGELRQGNAAYFAGNPGTLALVLQIDNTSNTYTVKTGKLTVSEFALDVTGKVRNEGNVQQLDLVVSGSEIDLAKALTLLPERYRNDIAGYTAAGDFYADATIRGPLSDSLLPVIEGKFGIRSGGSLARQGSAAKLTDISFAGRFSSGRGREGIELSEFSGKTGTSRFSGRFAMDGFRRPHYTASLNGTLNLGELQELLQLDTIEKAAGTVELKFTASGSPSTENPLTAADFRQFKTSGEMRLKQVVCRIKNNNLPVDSMSGYLGFDGNNVAIRNFRVRSGTSDLAFEGKLRNLLGYLFTATEVLDITATLRSDLLDLNGLLATQPAGSADTSYQLVLPDRLRLTFSADVGQVRFRQFDAKAFKGDVALRNRRLVADPVSFYAMDGKIVGSGMIDGTRTDSLLITGNARTERVNINKLFVQLENFGQTTLTNKHVRGTLTADLNFASVWGSDLLLNEKKLYAAADITIDQGQLIGFQPLEELSRFVKLDDLKNIRFNTLTNHIEIRDRTIIIPEMDIRSNAIDITMSGTHNFDNIVDYHLVVGLDELLAKKVKAANPANQELGIVEEDDGGHRTKLYILMKGPLDKPDIRYDPKGMVRGLRNDLKQESQSLKQILNEEFGWFKKDSTATNKKPIDKNRKKNDQEGKFIIKFEDSSDKEPPPDDGDF